MSSNAAKEEIVNKFNLLTAEHEKLLAKRSKLECSIDETSKQIADCHAAARLFGFDLSNNSEIFPEGAPDGPFKPLIRNFVIEYLKTSSLPLKAKEIQKAYEDSYHVKLHYKTVGMTLYRLKEDGIARREGRNWYLAEGEDLVV